MSDKVVARRPELLRSATVYVGANFVASAVPLMLMPILTRVLTPYDYGIVALFNVCVAIVGVFAGLSVQGLIAVQFSRMQRADYAKLITACLLILAVSGVLVALTALIIQDQVERAIAVPQPWLLVASLVAALQFIVNIRLSVLQHDGRPWAFAGIQLLQAALSAGLSLWLIIVAGMAWEGRLFGIVASAAVLTAVAIVGLWRDRCISLTTSLEHVKAGMRFGVPLIPHTLGGLLIYRVDQVIIASVLGPSDAGNFAIAVQVGMVLQYASIALNRAYSAWLYRNLSGMSHSDKRAVVGYTYGYFLLMMASALLLGIGAPFLMPLLVGKAFHVPSAVMIYVALGFGFGGMYFAVTSFVFEAGATSRLALITSLCGFSNIALTYLSVRHWGLQGAGIGFMISQAIFFVGTWLLANRVNPMPWFHVLRKAGTTS